jgi:glycosyltransferase involved in cell wall biosynthesis
MPANSPLITIAIPAYNRPEELGALLETAVAQDFDEFEVLVVEDCSPRRAEIEAVVRSVGAHHPGRRIRFEANSRNLGYDANLRRILELSDGAYTLFMGDDDLLRPGALRRVAEAVRAHPDAGVVLRAYEHVDYATGEQLQVFRYFPEDRYFPPGLPSILTFFRRSVAIAGYTVHTETARRAATDRYDGTLLYQLHLSTQVLAERAGLYLSDILTAMRKDDRQRHFFGSAAAERGLHRPNALEPSHSVNFMRGMCDLAREEEAALGLPIHDAVLDDLSNYSYPFLKLHAGDRRAFLSYVKELRRLGLGRRPLFWAYVGALVLVPVPWLDAAVAWAKRILPATPRLGRVYAGEDLAR